MKRIYELIAGSLGATSYYEDFAALQRDMEEYAKGEGRTLDVKMNDEDDPCQTYCTMTCVDSTGDMHGMKFGKFVTFFFIVRWHELRG